MKAAKRMALFNDQQAAREIIVACMDGWYDAVHRKQRNDRVADRPLVYLDAYRAATAEQPGDPHGAGRAGRKAGRRGEPLNVEPWCTVVERTEYRMGWATETQRAARLMRWAVADEMAGSPAGTGDQSAIAELKRRVDELEARLDRQDRAE